MNSFLDKALELAVSSLGPVQVQVDPADLQVRAEQPATSILIFEIPIRWMEVDQMENYLWAMEAALTMLS